MQQFPNWDFVFYHPVGFFMTRKFYFVQSHDSMEDLRILLNQHASAKRVAKPNSSCGCNSLAGLTASQNRAASGEITGGSRFGVTQCGQSPPNGLKIRAKILIKIGFSQGC